MIRSLGCSHPLTPSQPTQRSHTPYQYALLRHPSFTLVYTPYRYKLSIHPVNTLVNTPCQHTLPYTSAHTLPTPYTHPLTHTPYHTIYRWLDRTSHKLKATHSHIPIHITPSRTHTLVHPFIPSPPPTNPHPHINTPSHTIYRCLDPTLHKLKATLSHIPIHITPSRTHNLISPLYTLTHSLTHHLIHPIIQFTGASTRPLTS